MAEVVVAGAGVVGCACALTLVRDGHSVVLLDRQQPGEACSAGNAAILAVDATAPLASPKLLRSLPGMLLNRLAPAHIRLRDLAALRNWYWRFLGQMKRANRVRSGSAIAALTAAALDAHHQLLTDTQAAEQITQKGWLLVYESAAALERMADDHALQRDQGIEIETWNRERIATEVPALAAHAEHAAYFPRTAQVAEPQQLVKALARRFEELGGEYRCAPVRSIRATGSGAVLDTGDDQLHAEHAVISLGVHSAGFCRALGEPVPLAAERGYHAMLPHAQPEIPIPVLINRYRAVATPLQSGLRLAGTSEITTPGSRANLDRARVLCERMQRYLPDLDTRDAELWSGMRSTTPDSLPVLGASARHRGIWYAFGHQHLGLTLSAVTARAIADGIGRRNASIDLSPYRVDRF